MRSYWVYILANKPRGTLYIGVTNGIIFRVERHRAGKGSSFTRRYKVHRLVWFQEFGDVREAIQREKTMKEWPRAWKVNLIERENPHWDDLYPPVYGRQRSREYADGWVPGTSPGMTVECAEPSEIIPQPP